MGPKSLTNLLSYKSEKTDCNLRYISNSNNMKNSVMYDGTRLRNGTVYQKTLHKEIKSISSCRNKSATHIYDEQIL